MCAIMLDMWVIFGSSAPPLGWCQDRVEVPAMSLLPCLLPAADRVTGAPPGRFGDPLVDAYLEFLVGQGAPELGAGGVVRPEGLLRGGREAGGRGHAGGRVRVHHGPTHRRRIAAGRRDGAGPRGHGGGVVADGPPPVVDDQRLVWVPDRAGRCAGEPGTEGPAAV